MKKFLTLIFIIGIATSCNMPANNTGHMSGDKAAKNQARIKEFYDKVFNAHNVAMIDSFCNSDFVNHTPQQGHSGKGIADLKAEIGEFISAFPDVHITPDYMSSIGDTTFVKMTITGTNSGAMGPNMPATNKSMNIEGVDIIVVKDNLGTERWGYLEDMKMMAQLGMLPAPGEHKMQEEKTIQKKK